MPRKISFPKLLSQAKNPIQKLMLERIIEKGISESKELSEISGVPEPAISRFLNGADKISTDNVSKLMISLGIIKYDNVTPAHLPERRSRPIPVISWVHAGEFAEPVDNWPVGVSGEGEPVFVIKNVSAHAFGLIVSGDSMEPRFFNGDIIVIDPELECSNGCPCVAKVNDEVTFKYFYENGTEIRLKPMNPKYPDMVFPKDGQVRFKVIGPVVELVAKI